MKNYFPNEVKTVQKPLEYSESGEEEGLQLKDSMREYLKKQGKKKVISIYLIIKKISFYLINVTFLFENSKENPNRINSRK